VVGVVEEEGEAAAALSGPARLRATRAGSVHSWTTTHVGRIERGFVVVVGAVLARLEVGKSRWKASTAASPPQ
jgi:hypothetical protein